MSVTSSNHPEMSLASMESHEEAYDVWKRLGLKNRILLHLDAHMDFKWIAPSLDSLLDETTLEAVFLKTKKYRQWNLQSKPAQERVHLGNYIYQAIDEKIISRFIWIYPDAPEGHAQFCAVRRMIDALAQAEPRRFQYSADTEKKIVHGDLCGIPFTAAPFSCLQYVWGFHEKPLLNIDLDFMVIQNCYGPFYPYPDLMNPRAWLSPKTLVSKIKQLEIETDLVTLAYSVEEGYVPLSLKFLGDELAARLKGNLGEEERGKYSLLHELSNRPLQYSQGVMERLINISEKRPSADVCFALAMGEANHKNWDSAREYYQKAVSWDPSYQTRFNHPGPIFWRQQRYSEADISYQRMEMLDPGRSDHRLYQLDQKIRRKKWEEGIRFAKQMIQDGMGSFFLRYCLGKCHFELQEYGEAWDLLNRDEDGISDEPYYVLYLLLKIRTAEKSGQLRRAIQIAHEWRLHAPGDYRVHGCLAALYGRASLYAKAWKHGVFAIRAFIMVSLHSFLQRWKNWGLLKF